MTKNKSNHRNGGRRIKLKVAEIKYDCVIDYFIIHDVT